MAQYVNPVTQAEADAEIRVILYSSSVSKTLYNSLEQFTSMQEAKIGSMYKFNQYKVILKTSETTARFYYVDE